MYVVPYERRYRQAALDLIFYTRIAHIQLDWHQIEMWMETSDMCMWMAWEDEQLLGLICISTPLDGAAWLRVIAVQDDADIKGVLQVLWESAYQYLQVNGVKTVNVLVLTDWLFYHLKELGFAHLEDVITLHRFKSDVPYIDSTQVHIRPVNYEDLNTLIEIDHAAFRGPWRLSATDLRQAQRHAASCTLAQIGDRFVGYQLTTERNRSAHLARLAVIPELQGKNVGKVILTNLIESFIQRGIKNISVNTQASNINSQKLYRYFGFKRTGYDLPVWQKHL